MYFCALLLTSAIADLIDVNIALPEAYVHALKIDNATLARLDRPAGISMWR